MSDARLSLPDQPDPTKPVHDTLPRIKVGVDYAIRDRSGTLVETGYIDENGHYHPDRVKLGRRAGQLEIDGSNPAATVPWNQWWQ